LSVSLVRFSRNSRYNLQITYGLDATNDKSFLEILFHKSNDVPYEEQNNQIEYSFAVRW
jgi:hypothetical protein